MPINDYRCVCGYVFMDIDDRVKEKYGLVCPKCGKRDVVKLPPNPNVKVVGGTPKFHGGR